MLLPLLAFCAVARATAAEQAAVVVSGSVEHLVAPLGIATLRPRFSWQLSSARGARNLTQTAFELQVDASSDFPGGAGSCTSGEVTSPAANLVECGPGVPLLPGRLYWWRVTVSLSDGSKATMHPQRFSTGLQTRGDWHPSASFLGLPSPPNGTSPDGKQVVCPWLRSETFTVTRANIDSVNSGEVSALLSVASIGWHEVYLNGQRLEELSVLIPSVSDMHRRVLSHQYDTKGLLQPGPNTLAFWAAPGWSQLTWPDNGWTGPGTDFNITAAPLVMAQLSLCPGGSGKDCNLLVTSTAAGEWMARSSTIEHTGGWQWGNYGGEKIDWAQHIPNWSTATPLPTDGWVRAAAVPIDKAVTPESLEPMAPVETLRATGIAKCSAKAAGSCYVVSFSKLFNGFFSAMSLPGLKTGQSVTFTYSANCLSPCPAVAPYMPCAPPTVGTGVCTAAATEWNAIDAMIAGAQMTSFSNKFNWHTFQFVTIETNGTLLLSDADLPNFVGSRITNRQKKVGSFKSSSSVLNQVYEAFVQTYEGLTVSGMQVDCTNRERLGYGGDAHSRIEFAMDSYESHALYSKWLTDWHDTQKVGPVDDKESPHVFGNVPNTAPTYSGAGSPMWGGITVLLPFELYRRSGDRRMLEDAYPAMKSFLDFMIHFGTNTTDGLVHPTGFDWLGDWQAPHGCSDGNDPDLYNNAYIIYALRRAVEIIQAIGDEKVASSADSLKFELAAEQMSKALHQAFYNSASHCYSPYVESHGNHTYGTPRQGHQIMALVAGAVPPSLISTVLDSLFDELSDPEGTAAGHIDTGLHTTYFLGKMLSGGMEEIVGAAADRADLIYAATMNPTWPSYSALIAAGLTTWPETWAIGNVAGGVSKMHGTLNGFGLTFPQAFLGVKLPFSLRSGDSPAAHQLMSLTIRPSYFLRGAMFPAPPPPPRPPPPGPPCLGGLVSECGSSITGTCTADRELNITCKPGTGSITGISFASWGTPSGTCGEFKASASCNDTRAYGIAVAACVGKTSCSITPSAFCSSTASTGSDPRCPFANHDPCLGKSKHLAVQAIGCKPLPQPPPPPPPPPPLPQNVPPLTAASGEVHTVHGAVSVAWNDTGGSGPESPVSMAISIPIGVDNTTVWIVGKSNTVTESGKPATSAEGVQFVREAIRQGEPYSVWAVGSGSYTFSSHR